MSSPKQQEPPKAPDPGKTYKQGLQTWLQYLPKMIKTEEKYRGITAKFLGISQSEFNKLGEDQKRILAQQKVQELYGPQQYEQQLAALKQLDPTGYALRENLGGKISGFLDQGYVDPQQAAAYQALGRGTLGEYNRGYDIGPSLGREIQQGIEARLASTGNWLGNAPTMASAVYRGQRAQQLYQQRLANLMGFTQLRSPEELAVAEAGAFASLPTPIQQIQGIQGVSPDRSWAYMNPNAGYQGQQFGLQNYPNQAYGQQGGPNPWMGALAGAAGGAASGAMLGSVYPGIGTAAGAIGGGLVGGIGGYFSDPSMKEGVKKIGNVPIYEYRYKPQYGIAGTFRGPMSTDVKKLDRGAVKRVFGRDFVMTPNKLGLNRVKIKED
jgi:hypothetical protein